MKNTIKAFVIGLAAISAVSCSDFLNRPSESSYTLANYYKSDTQCEQGIYYLYNSPWYDIIRFFIYDSETMAGNVFMTSAYQTLTANGTDQELKDMSASLWAVNAQCNTVIDNILNAEGPSQAIKNKCIGEALSWKAMAYFFLVRTFGEVPIIHNNTEIIKEASYNQVQKVERADVYDYIILTLEKALTLLPKDANIGKYNRIDYYAAEALLAKVYLTKAGVSGSLDRGDLEKAKELALDVVLNSGRTLTPKYQDVFRLAPSVYQQTGECLFSWLWTSTSGIWTAQNSIQSDVGLTGFDEFGDLWGDWKGPTVDLQEAFEVSAAVCPQNRVDVDDRRKATCLMFGDQHDIYWTDKGGFDFYRYLYDKEYAPGTVGSWPCASGALYAKHLYGDNADHVAALGVNADRMCNQLPTHILRLGDIYLVLAEAAVLTGDNATALEYVNKIRARANATLLTSVTWEDVWKERRLELALEGDRWYDFVRRSYYDADGCIAELVAQKRSHWDGLQNAYKNFVVDDEGNYAGPGAHTWDGSEIVYNAENDLSAGMIKPSVFTMPMPSEDVVLNPGMASDVKGIHVDVRATYVYNF